eukprot:jgi/Botrbrau1/21813/Bobra.0190s0033.3
MNSVVTIQPFFKESGRHDSCQSTVTTDAPRKESSASPNGPPTVPPKDIINNVAKSSQATRKVPFRAAKAVLKLAAEPSFSSETASSQDSGSQTALKGRPGKVRNSDDFKGVKISPSEHRRLRRRITNRESARRMRAKRQQALDHALQEAEQLRLENQRLSRRLADTNRIIMNGRRDSSKAYAQLKQEAAIVYKENGILKLYLEQALSREASREALAWKYVGERDDALPRGQLQPLDQGHNQKHNHSHNQPHKQRVIISGRVEGPQPSLVLSNQPQTNAPFMSSRAHACIRGLPAQRKWDASTLTDVAADPAAGPRALWRQYNNTQLQALVGGSLGHPMGPPLLGARPSAELGKAKSIVDACKGEPDLDVLAFFKDHNSNNQLQFPALEGILQTSTQLGVHGMATPFSLLAASSRPVTPPPTRQAEPGLSFHQPLSPGRDPLIDAGGPELCFGADMDMAGGPASDFVDSCLQQTPEPGDIDALPREPQGGEALGAATIEDDAVADLELAALL